MDLRLDDSDAVEALAAGFRCSDCDNFPVLALRNEEGQIEHMWIVHQEDCPVLNRVIDPLGDIRRAAGGDAEYITGPHEGLDGPL
nr:hypothetical protein [Streptomyces sp. TLI_235]